MLRAGHKQFGKRPINGEEALWAYEHLDIDQKRLEAMGAVDLMVPLKLSPCNHEGENIQAKVIQWTGTGWKSTDWIKIDSMMFVPTFVRKPSLLRKSRTSSHVTCLNVKTGGKRPLLLIRERVSP